MRNISFFVEDRGHELFLMALLYRFANQFGISITIKVGNAKSGHGAVLNKLKGYLNDILHEQERLPDLLIAATDGNCKGYKGRKKEVDNAIKGFQGTIICAIPDPHIERWLLLDSTAFKKVLGKGCAAPPQKCERDLYKRLLLQAVRDAGVNPPLGGIEYTEDLVKAFDLDYLERTDESLGRFLGELRHIFEEWQRAEQVNSWKLHEGSQTYVLDIDSSSPQA